METLHGILIQRRPFSDTSLIVTWITPEQGVIKTMAKGALRPKSPLGPVLDLFYRCEIQCKLSTKGELHTLREARLEHPYLALRRDWRVVLCAQYFADLLTCLTEPHAAIIDYFTIFQKGLDYLETHLPSAYLVQRYERKMLELSGLSPDLPHALTRAVMAHHHALPITRERLLDVIKKLGDGEN